MRVFYSFCISLIMVGCNQTNGKRRAKIQSTLDGAGLYNKNCITCHKCGVDFTGPSLKGATTRWKDKELMYAFIKNPMAVIQKDSYAAELQMKYKIIMLPSMLTKDEIDAVLDYCDNEGEQ